MNFTSKFNKEISNLILYISVVFFQDSLLRQVHWDSLNINERPEDVLFLKPELCARMRPAEKCRALFFPGEMTCESCSSLCASDRNNICSGFLWHSEEVSFSHHKAVQSRFWVISQLSINISPHFISRTFSRCSPVLLFHYFCGLYIKPLKIDVVSV